jgi:hypothetical protein
MDKTRNMHRILAEKPEEMRSLGSLRCWLEDNI